MFKDLPEGQTHYYGDGHNHEPIKAKPKKNELDILIRDLTQVGSIPKSEAKRRIEILLAEQKQQLEAEFEKSLDVLYKKHQVDLEEQKAQLQQVFVDAGGEALDKAVAEAKAQAYEKGIKDHRSQSAYLHAKAEGAAEAKQKLLTEILEEIPEGIPVENSDGSIDCFANTGKLKHQFWKDRNPPNCFNCGKTVEELLAEQKKG